MIRSLRVVAFLALYLLLMGPPFILHALLTRSVTWLYFVGVGGAKIALRLAGIRVRVAGRENIPPGVCIFVANHTSNVDPPVVVAAIPRRVALLAKKEIFAIPILAQALRLASFVPVDRENRAAAIAGLEEATQHLKAGVSFLVFPEGTRSPDGRLRSFKKGTFIMAINAGVPVVPVSVIGAHHCMRRDDWRVHAGEVEVVFHPPIEASRFTLETRDALIARVHAAAASALPPGQQPLAPPAGADDA